MKVFCFHCKKTNEGLLQVGRRDECSFCKSDLHACKNCQMYDLKNYNECKEPSADVVKEKERANFCDFFKAKESGDVLDAKAKLLSAAEALFKKS
jgi:hypothetical protein